MERHWGLLLACLDTLNKKEAAFHSNWQQSHENSAVWSRKQQNTAEKISSLILLIQFIHYYTIYLPELKKKKSDLINIFIFTIQHILKDSCLRFGPLDFWKPDVQFFFIEYHRLVLVIYIKEVPTGLYRLHKNHCDFKYILLCI